MRILVTGATGFVGSRLAAALTAAGHDIVAMTRRPGRYRGPGTAVRGDVADPATLPGAMRDCEVAYYLVHSLDHRDFRTRDAAAARAFGVAASSAGVGRIVYLGGLGDPADTLSHHLRSRQECEALLAEAGVPVVTLRAGIVIGDLGTSWEIVRALVQWLPAMPVPTWTSTLTQPISIADTVRYLVGVLDLPPAPSRHYDIGGAEVLRYADVLSRLSAVERRPSLLVPVPVPSIRLAAALSARVLPLLAGVDGRTVQSLVESLRNEVIVRDPAIRALIPFAPMDYDDAVLAALEQRRARLARR